MTFTATFSVYKKCHVFAVEQAEISADSIEAAEKAAEGIAESMEREIAEAQGIDPQDVWVDLDELE